MKIAKNLVMLKSLKTLQCRYKLYSKILSNTRGGSLDLEARYTYKMTKIFKKNLKKIASFIRKIDKICDIKKLKTILKPIKVFQ